MISLIAGPAQPATVGGITYPVAVIDGSVDFFSTTFNASDLSPTNLTVTAPFDFAGHISGHPSSGSANNLFVADLIGAGSVTATFRLDPTLSRPGHDVFAFVSVTYTFEPVPPPSISSLTATPNVLWPPNHKMVPVSVDISASDASGVAPICQITAVSSTEGIQVPGETDWIITGPRTVQLRAERDGSGPGRVYTISVTCTNAAGLTATKGVTVRVPHDRSN